MTRGRWCGWSPWGPRAARIGAAMLVVMLESAAVVRAMAFSPGETIAAAARRVVKVYGAGGVRGLEAYQSGVLVSPAGHVVTVMSTVLDAEAIDCVLDDGRRYQATLRGIDPQRELALLEIEGEELPAFVIDEAAPLAVGSRIFALSNLFGVAVGDERVSVQQGVIAAFVPLAARRGAYEAPFQGDVYILDCTTNNPGSPGGALVDRQGRLVGILGKELRSATSGVWLNYALPAAEVATSYRQMAAGETIAPPPADAATAFDPLVLGVVLVPDLLDKTPPFVESVNAGSAAARAGLVPDDLLVAVSGRAVASRAAVRQALALVPEGDPVRVTVVRRGALVDCDLGPRPAGGRR
jgi:S1-C subfamily serine protease